MGTNFYWHVDLGQLPTGEAVRIDRDDPNVHIGKRSAAGMYCWDCDVTLCKEGKDGVHKGSDIGFSHGIDAYLEASKRRWHECCPNCGRSRQVSEGMSGAVAVELGFAKPETERRTGISGCSSFT